MAESAYSCVYANRQGANRLALFHASGVIAVVRPAHWFEMSCEVWVFRRQSSECNFRSHGMRLFCNRAVHLSHLFSIMKVEGTW